MEHLTQATTEDIFHGQKIIESSPKNETRTSFRAQHNLFEDPYCKQDKNSRFKKRFFVKVSEVTLSIFYPTGEQIKLAKIK